MLGKILIFISLVFLAGCAAESYRYESPVTQDGRVCVQKCDKALARCLDRERRLQDSCLESRDYSRKNFEMCSAATGGEIAVDCMPVRNCPVPDEIMCKKHFNSCWEDCGGKVSVVEKGSKDEKGVKDQKDEK